MDIEIPPENLHKRNINGNIAREVKFIQITSKAAYFCKMVTPSLLFFIIIATAKLKRGFGRLD